MKFLQTVILFALLSFSQIVFAQTIVEVDPPNLVTFSVEMPELTKLSPELRLTVLSDGQFVGFGASGSTLIQFEADRSLQEIKKLVESNAGGKVFRPLRKMDQQAFTKQHHGIQQGGPLDAVSKIEELIILTADINQDSATFAGFDVVNRSMSGRFTTVRQKGGFSSNGILRLARENEALYIEPNIQLELFNSTTPDDPMYLAGKQWGLKEAQFSEAWSSGSTASSVIVAVIDTGIDYEHEDLVSNIWTQDSIAELDESSAPVHGYDFRDEDHDPRPGYGESHGTQVAGIIGAVSNNGVGFAGAAWTGLIMPLRVFSRSNGNTDDAADAIDFAVSNGAKIINVSWGTKVSKDTVRLKTAVKNAEAAGVLIIAAAGNTNTNIDLESAVFPVSYANENIIGVAASDAKGELWKQDEQNGSNFGSRSVDIVAPGSGILSLFPENGYDDIDDSNDDGTSFAAPYVTAAAALLWTQFTSESPGLTDLQISRKVKSALLSNSALRIKFKDMVVTGGQLNLAFMKPRDEKNQVDIIDAEIEVSGTLSFDTLSIGGTGTGVFLLTEDQGPVQIDFSQDSTLKAFLRGLEGEEITLKGVLTKENQVPIGDVMVLLPDTD